MGSVGLRPLRGQDAPHGGPVGVCLQRLRREDYPWGEEAPTLDHANFAPGCEPVERKPTPVEAHAKNVSPFGCIDMAGNLAEWCLDNYWPNYGYEGAEGPDPIYVADEEDEHVARGGCGLHSEDYLRCSSRDCYPPGLRDNLIGFRCVSKA